MPKFYPLTETLDDFNRAAGVLEGSEMSSKDDSWADPIEIDSDDSALEITQLPTANEGVGHGRANSVSARGTGRSVGSYDRRVDGGVEVWATIWDANDANAVIRLWWAISDPNGPNPDGYFLEYDNLANTFKVFEKTGVTETEILSLTDPVLDEGDKIGIWHENSVEGTIHVYVYDASGTDEFVEQSSTVDDITHESGFIGLDIDPGSASAIDDFGGGQRPLKLSAPTTKVGTFIKIDTGVGDQQTISLPFTPQAVILWCTRRISVGFANHMELSYGFSDGTNHYSINATSDDGQTNSHCDRRHRAKALTIWETIATSNTLEAECDLSIVAGGFTLDWTTNCAHEYIINYMAISGVENAKVGTFTLGGGGTGNKSFAGVGFSPDLLFFAGCSIASAPPAVDVHAMFELGWCNRNGEEAAVAVTSEDALVAAPESNTVRMQVTTRCLLGMSVTGESTLEEASFVSMDSDGFTLNLDKSGFDRVWGYLALTGVASEIGVDTQKITTVGEKTTTLTTTEIGDAVGLMLYSTNRVASGSAGPDARVSVGGATAPGVQACIWGGDRDDSPAVPASDMATVSDRVLILSDTDNPTAVDAEADLIELHPDQFILDWTTVDGDEREFVYVVFGPKRETSPPPSNVQCKVGTLTTPASTGNQNVDVGFVPKAIIFWGTKDTAVPADSANISHFLGFATAVGEEWAIWAGSEDNLLQGTVHAQKRHESNSIILCNTRPHGSPDTDALNPDQRILANLNAILSVADGDAVDGFQLNFTLTTDSGVIVNYMALGGSGIKNAKVIEQNIDWDQAVDSVLSITGVGFPPDMVMGLGTGRALGSPENDLAEMAFGIGLKDNSQFLMSYMSDTHTTEFEATLYRPGRFVGQPSDNTSGGFQGEFVARLIGMIEDGFQIQIEKNDPSPIAGEPITSPHRFGFLCIQGPQFAIGRTLTRDTTGLQALDEGADFVPVGMILMCTNSEPIHAYHWNAFFSFGATDGTNEGAIWGQSTKVDPITLSDRNRAMRTNRVMRVATDPATDAGEASIDNFFRGGAVINHTTSNGRQWEMAYLLMGPAPAPLPSPPGAPGAMGPIVSKGRDRVVGY